MTLELTAYCDESGTQNHDLVLAGYLAPASEWREVEAAWKRTLGDAHLSEFKTCDCHHGRGEFKSRENRIELREKFLSIIDSAKLDGFAVRVDLTSFGDVRQKLASSIRAGFNEAYLHAFSALLQFLTNLVADRPRDERVRFVFDENGQFSGRALQVFQAMTVMPSVSYRDRLAQISFGDSQVVVPLQAADTLAYRVHRDLYKSFPLQTTRVQGFDQTGRVHVALLGSNVIRVERVSA